MIIPVYIMNMSLINQIVFFILLMVIDTILIDMKGLFNRLFVSYIMWIILNYLLYNIVLLVYFSLIIRLFTSFSINSRDILKTFIGCLLFGKEGIYIQLELIKQWGIVFICLFWGDFVYHNSWRFVFRDVIVEVRKLVGVWLYVYYY
jgi:hypothetical protein